MKTNETAATAVETPEYDGVETWEETINLGSAPIKRTAKINMSTAEVKKFMGDNDPALYFRNGKIPTWYKEFGAIVDPEEEETAMFREIFSDMPEALLFKHKRQSLYNVLVPKPATEFELANGDMIKEHEVADFRAIAFGGTNQPKTYEKTFFRIRLTAIHNNLLKGMARLKEWRAHRATV